MSNEEIISNLSENFVKMFKERIKEKNLEVPEITEDDIKNVVSHFFEEKTLTQAEKYMYKIFDTFVKDTYKEVNWKLDVETRKQTPEYKSWLRFNDIRAIWGDCRSMLRMDEEWVKVNGKAHIDEEAATIAADKWCQLIFGWHLQDNGAANEDHPGGFSACALGTILANEAKKDITGEMENKAHELFKEYYMRFIHYSKTYDKNDIEWLKKNLPDKDNEYDWEYYKFMVDLYCDYGPSTPLFLILENAGVPEKNIDSICPWKTGISIRTIDNSVQYQTYQHIEDL